MIGSKVSVASALLLSVGLLAGGCSDSSSGSGGSSASGSTATGGASADTTPPTFTPEAGSGPGSFHEGVATITLTAEDDDSGVQTVLVNGVNAFNTSGDIWEAQPPLRPGVNRIEVEVTDGAGNTAEGGWEVFFADVYRDINDMVDAGSIYIADSGFAALSTLTTDMLQQQHQLVQAFVGQVIAVPNTLTSTLNLTVSNASFDPPTVTLTPTDTGLHAVVELTDVDIATTGGDITADRITVGLNLNVAVANGVYTVTTPAAGATQGVTVVSENLDIDPPLPWPLPQPPYGPLVDPLVVTAIETALPPALEGALNSLTPSYSQDVLGVTFTATAQPSAIRYSADGIQIDVEANIASSHQGTIAGPGSLGVTGAAAPAIPGTHDIYVDLHKELINRAVYAAWDAGLLGYTIDQQTLAQLGVNLPFVLDGRWLALVFPPIAAMIQNPLQPVPMGLQMGFDLPPSVGLDTATPNVRGAFGGTHASVVMDFGTGYQPVLTLAIAGELGADIAVSAGHVDIALAQPTSIHFDVTAAGNPLGLSLHNINTFVNTAIGQGIALLGNVMPSIPLPAIPAIGGFPGMSLQSLEGEVTSPAHFTVRADLP